MTVDPIEPLANPTPAAEGFEVEDDYAGASVSRDPVYIGGDAGLTLTETNAVMSDRDSVVVLVAGEVASGKSTIVVELFGRFLNGPFASWSYAGSRTLRALDVIHRAARLSSGERTATTERTRADDMRVMHLDLAKRDQRVSLLITDVRGEFFEDLTNGTDVDTSVPLAKRADLCVLVLDGEKLADAESRGMTIWRATQLVGGLTEVGGLSSLTPILIVVSKSDVIAQSELKSVEEDVRTSVVELAKVRGLQAEYLAISARPIDVAKSQTNLKALLDWLMQDRSRSPQQFAPDRRSGRIAWRQELET